MNEEKRVSYTDILIQLPQIKSNNFVKHYQQSFQYESKIYLDTTYWTNIMLMWLVPFCSYANMFPHEILLEIVNATPNSLHPNGFISEEGDTTGIAQWLDDINLKLK